MQCWRYLALVAYLQDELGLLVVVGVAQLLQALRGSLHVLAQEFGAVFLRLKDVIPHTLHAWG